MGKEVFDRNWVLEAGIDVEVLKELVTIFLSGLDSELAALNIGINSGDLDSVQRVSHKLKGAAAQLGAMRVGATAEELNNLCKKLINSIRNKMKRGMLLESSSVCLEQFKNFAAKIFDYIHRGEENKPTAEKKSVELSFIANELYFLSTGKDIETMKILSDELINEVTLFKKEFSKL